MIIKDKVYGEEEIKEYSKIKRNLSTRVSPKILS